MKLPMGEPAIVKYARKLDPRPHRIWIPGQPQPAPKKDVAKVGDRLVPVDHDYRERKNPITGEKEKFDRGYKKRWVRHVTSVIHTYLIVNHLKPFAKSHPIGFGCLFYLPQADGNTKTFPAQVPDLDNLKYAIWNALKRTPAKRKGQPSRNPHGTLFYEDDQVVWSLYPDGKLWASEDTPPGVLVSWCDAADIYEELMQWQNPHDLRIL